MRPVVRLVAFALALALVTLTAQVSVAEEPASMKIPAPALQGIEECINTKALALKDLKRQVVVLHFWTFG